MSKGFKIFCRKHQTAEVGDGEMCDMDQKVIILSRVTGVMLSSS